MTRASVLDPSVLTRPIWLALTYAFTALAWSVAALVWSRGEKAIAASVFAGGLSLGPCLAGYLSTPRRYKQLLLRIVLATGGLSILAPLASATSLELESVVVLLLAGTMGAAIGHALITVILGPLAPGRLLVRLLALDGPRAAADPPEPQLQDGTGALPAE